VLQDSERVGRQEAHVGHRCLVDPAPAVAEPREQRAVRQRRRCHGDEAREQQRCGSPRHRHGPQRLQCVRAHLELRSNRNSTISEQETPPDQSCCFLFLRSSYQVCLRDGDGAEATTFIGGGEGVGEWSALAASQKVRRAREESRLLPRLAPRLDGGRDIPKHLSRCVFLGWAESPFLVGSVLIDHTSLSHGPRALRQGKRLSNTHMHKHVHTT
jgi:hypothetical protein